VRKRSLAGAAGLATAASALVVPHAEAAQEFADLAAADTRILSVLLVLGPAVGWVLFNITQPALNSLQVINDKRSKVATKGKKAVKKRVVRKRSLAGAAGLATAASALVVPHAEAAQEVAMLADNLSPNQIFTALFLSLFTGFLALRLGKALYD